MLINSGSFWSLFCLRCPFVRGCKRSLSFALSPRTLILFNFQTTLPEKNSMTQIGQNSNNFLNSEVLNRSSLYKNIHGSIQSTSL